MHEATTALVEETLRISGTDPKKCMRCGKCLATCPSDIDVSPHKFAKHLAEGSIEALSASKTLWRCLSCLACIERCPRGVEPASLIEAVRLSVTRPQGGNHLKPEQIPMLIEDDPEIPQQLLVSAFRKYTS